MKKTAQQARKEIPRPGSLTVDPDRLSRMLAMTPAQRRQAAAQGQLSLGEMLKWAARRPHEVPIVNAEFFFISALSADTEGPCDTPPGGKVSRRTTAGSDTPHRQGRTPLMPDQNTYLSCAQTAKLLRPALRATFPDIRFRVRSHTYAGGASIDVAWTDGPTTGQVRGLTCLYEGASFDGMTDLKTYHDTLLAAEDGQIERVHFGADFIHTSRHISQHTYGQLAQAIAKLTGRPCDLAQIRYEGKQRLGQNGAGWNTRYPLTVCQEQLCRTDHAHEYGYELAGRYLHNRDLRSGFPGTIHGA